VVVVVFWAYRVPWRKLVWLAVPAAVVFAAEMAFNWIEHGSPIERLTVTGSHDGFRAYITDSRLDAVLRLPDVLTEFPSGWPLLLLIVLVPVAVGLRWRPSAIVGAWVGVFWLLLTLGTGLVFPDFRFLDGTQLRYWTPILPAVAIAGVAVLERGLCAVRDVIPRAPSWSAEVGAVVVVAVLMVVGGREDRSLTIYRTNGADQLAELRSWLESDGQDVDVVWTDSFTARLLPLYARTPFGERIWDGKVRTFDRDGELRDLDELDGGVVVLHQPGARILPGTYPRLVERFDGDPAIGDVLVRRDDDTLIIFAAD
jgi:hypothetical protein